MNQNLIDAVLEPDKKEAVKTAIITARENLNFLISLNPAQRSDLLKAGNTYFPFVELAQFPQVVSPLFDAEGFQKDKTLLEKLSSIHTLVSSLNEALDDTMMALRSDLFVAALDFYGSVQQNKDKVPGLDTRYAEMQEFFKRGKRKTPPIS
ncbi:MAG: hypothetical protein K8H86_01420 [Ignavibacteriaceae bacterium]|nr:hypothetical protein [Ignavibacteriaceae bacterium]